MVKRKHTCIENCQMILVKDSNGSTDDGDCRVMAIVGRKSLVQTPSQSQGYRSLQPKHEKRKWCERHGKSQKSVLGDKKTCNRKWEEMDHEILISIMKRYKWYEWHRSFYFDFIICKSWLSAFLDVLFPPGDILDLRLLDDHANFGCARGYADGRNSEYAWKIRMFYRYLKLNLDRLSPNNYTKLILSECILHDQAYIDIAQRLPALRSFVSPAKMGSLRERFSSYRYTATYSFVGGLMLGHWKNLEHAQCHITMLWDLAACCKSIRDLTLVGMTTCGPWLTDNVAAVIANGFPLLDRLSLSTYVFTFSGMSMILDGHKNLSYLDMKHTFCVPAEAMGRRWYRAPMNYTWPKDLADKIARVKTFLTCEGKKCLNCGHLYL